MLPWFFVDIDMVCKVCNQGVQTIFHILFDYNFTREDWSWSGLSINLDVITIQEWLHFAMMNWFLEQQQISSGNYVGNMEIHE